MHRGIVVLFDEAGNGFGDWMLLNRARVLGSGGSGGSGSWSSRWGNEGWDDVGAEVRQEMESRVYGKR